MVEEFFPGRSRQSVSHRPGYDRVRDLVSKYDELSIDERTQMSESDLSDLFVQPMFQALGWEVWVPTLASTKEMTLLDLELQYQELRVPVEVGRVDDLSALGVESFKRWLGARAWGVLTNFESIYIWDLEKLALILEASPLLYIQDEQEAYSLLAAQVFYERLFLTRHPLQALTDALNSPDDSERLRAAQSLGESGDTQAVELLISALDDTNELVQQAALVSLGDIGDAGAVEYLMPFLQNENESIRQTAAVALGKLGDSRAVGGLLLVSRDPNDSIRKSAVEALGEIRDTSALERLEEIAGHDSNATVRQSARVAVERIRTPRDERLPGAEEIRIAARALADSPSEVDLLGFSDYARALADFIKSEKTEKPLTIGVDAAWGMGKTTLMGMIREQLTVGEEKRKRRQTFPTVWFNAWKYDQEESLWAALALEILTQVRKQFSIWQRTRLWLDLNLRRFDWSRLCREVLKWLARVVVIGALGALVVGTASLWLGSTLGEVAQRLWQYIQIVGVLSFLTTLYAVGSEAYKRIVGPFDLKIAQYVRKPDYQEKIGFLAEFESDYRRVINAVTQGGKWPLVVFIDDLDRCEPPKPVEVIEAINLLLDAKHCVFVIGMDSRTVAGSIEVKYKDLREYLGSAGDPGRLTLGQRFLEKIIQIHFRIPRADPQVIRSFVDANLGVLEPESTGPSGEEVRAAQELIKAEQRNGQPLEQAARAVQLANPSISQIAITRAGEEVRAQSFDDSERVRQAIYDAVPYLGYNPRKIKRFVNSFRLQGLIANRRGLLANRTIDLRVLAKWVVVATCWPDALGVVMTDPGFIKRLRNACGLRARLTRLRSGELVVADDPEAEEKTESELNALLADPHIKRYIGVESFARLVQDMDDSDLEALPRYLYLAQITTETAGEAEASPT